MENVNAQSPNWLWAKGMGGTSSDIGWSTTVDLFGNVYTTGYFRGAVDFDPGIGVFTLTSAGGADIFISKLDASGNFVWAIAMSGANDGVANSIVLDASDNIYITGNFYGTVDFDPGAGIFNLTSIPVGVSDIFISKLDSSGNFIWARAMGGTINDVGYAMVVSMTSNDDVYCTGWFSGTADFDPSAGTYNLTSAGLFDTFILKLDSGGNFIWASAIGGTGDDYGHGIALDATNNVYTTGWFSGTADFNPNVVTFNLTSAGFSDIFISKLDNTGNFVWAKTMGGTLVDYGHSITLDASGNAYTTGFFSGTADFDPNAGMFNITSLGNNDIFISKLDSAGNYIWAKGMGGTGNEVGNSIALDAYGNCYTTGYFSGTADFDPGVGTSNLTSQGSANIFISKLNGAGNFVWAKAVGGTNNDYGLSIALDTAGKVYVAGSFNSDSVTFGSTTLTNDTTNFTSDIFIAKLDTVTIITGNNMIESFGHDILLYPNPATNNLTLSLGSNNKNVEVTISDITGEIIYTTTATASQKIEVNTNIFAVGIYVVQIQTANFIETKKLIIAK